MQNNNINGKIKARISDYTIKEARLTNLELAISTPYKSPNIRRPRVGERVSEIWVKL